MHYLKRGWLIAKRQGFLITLWFVYELLCAFILLKAVQETVTPLLHRYPGSLSGYASHLYLAEGQFLLVKTDLANRYLWLLLAFLALRMLLTPFLQAGIYYSIHQRQQENKSREFFQGIRRLGKPFNLIYWLQAAVESLPLLWLMPLSIRWFEHTGGSSSWQTVLPYWGIYLLFLSFSRLLFVYIRIGKTTDNGPLTALRVFFRHVHLALMLAGLLFLISLLAAAAILSASYLWSNLTAMILHLSGSLVFIMLTLWKIGAQYQLWMEKTA